MRKTTLHALFALATLTSTAIAQPDPATPTDPPAPDPAAAPQPPSPPTDAGPGTGATAAGISKAGDFGIGAESTLAGLTGLAGRYQVDDRLGLYGVLRLDVVTEDGFTDTYGLGAGLSYRLKAAETATIVLVAGLDLLRVSNEIMGMTNGTTAIALSAGLGTEWFVDPSLSLHAQAGISFAYITGEFGMADISGRAIRLGGETITSIGATYWFR